MVIIERDGLAVLVSSLQERGYTLVGPVARGGAIVLEEFQHVEDLAAGYRAEQGPGKYRLAQKPEKAVFAQATGPHSWKQFLFPPSFRLFAARKDDAGFAIDAAPPPPKRYAFFGVRPCDLHAIAIQDKVFLRGEYVDSAYMHTREEALIIALNCAEAGGTCFCASMKTGPRATEGFDIALTEIVTAEKHFFGLEVGTEKGRQALEGVPQRAVARGENQLLEEFFRNAAKKMGRTLDTTHIRELLTVHAEHPRWDVTATRCLTCTNCTMVCPTCFCSSAEDITDLGGNTAERWRRWDSCFTMEYSYIHGGSIRASVKSRYRQWMTHKLASWFDQFGTSGCVGCGRCITWCPVGIDITEEARAILSTGAGRPPVQAKEKKKHGNA